MIILINNNNILITMNIIKFPRKNNKIVRLTAKKENTDNGVSIGPFKFKCSICSTDTSFSSENMLFKKIEFFCCSCGAKFEVTNPAFTKNN